MTPLPAPAPAPVAELPTARGRIAPGQTANDQANEIRANGNLARVILVSVILVSEIPTSAIRATETEIPRGVAMTAPQRGNAGRKGQPDRKTTGGHGPLLTTAHPEGAMARPEEQAGTTVDGAHNISNCS